MPTLLLSRRIFPVVFYQIRNTRMYYAVDVSGGGRISAVGRKMPAKRLRGMPPTSPPCSAFGRSLSRSPIGYHDVWQGQSDASMMQATSTRNARARSKADGHRSIVGLATGALRLNQSEKDFE
jgi:hypothetical protein